jgi:protein required for attachment to host cells
MTHNWLVIANASRARVLEYTDTPGGFSHIADLVHPESRQKGVELAEQHGSDRLGPVEGSGNGPGSAGFQTRTDPREREHDRFAREVAKAVNDGVAAGRCAGVTLVASDPFLGHLKSHLSEHAHKLLLRTQSSDYTSLSDAEIAKRLRPVT